MKKFALFFTVFLFFGFLSAEEVNAAEAAEEVAADAENTECCCDVSRETEEKSKFFYFQPALEVGMTILAVYRVGVALDAGFLVGTIEKNTNVYLGLDFDFKLMPYYSADVYPVLSFPVLASTVFDIMLRNESEVKSISIRISLGADIQLGRGEVDDGVYTPFDVFVSYGWGTGFDLVFRNDVVFKFGIDSYFYGFFPDFVSGVGYRF